MKFLDRSFDTETTGLDPYHGSKPFFVTSCDTEGNQLWWEWPVDPLTREPIVSLEDLSEIQKVYKRSKTRVFHNSVFDVTQLQTLNYDKWTDWDWSNVEDTYLTAHLLNSSQPKDLTSLTLIYCGVNVSYLEDNVKEATQKARRICRSVLKDWWIAKEGSPTMPSVKGDSWKSDMWLMRAIIDKHPELLPTEYDLNEEVIWKQGDSLEDHSWNTVLIEYANADTLATINLYTEMKKELQDRGLIELNSIRQELLPIIHKMQKTGVTISQRRLDDLYDTYQRDSKYCEIDCKKIAKVYNYDLTLPKSGNNKSLLSFIFDKDKLDFPVVVETKNGNPSLDKSAVEEYLRSFGKKTIQYRFMRNLANKRKKDTSCNQMESYANFWLPIEGLDKQWRVLHPSLNPAGTSTLRWTSRNPSEQIISKVVDEYGTNIRYAFGPSPDREWWSFDYNNIELRIPAYESGEPDLINLFEHPDDPPYFGSMHLLNFSVVYPDLWEDAIKWHGEDGASEFVKKQYKDSYYQYCKNGGFAIQYGAQKGTADAAFRRSGSYEKLKEKFDRQATLNKHYILQAEKYGYVTTLPDSSLDNPRGYPLYCSRSSWGKISPTIPLNYHVQGTACWVIMKAMLDIDKYLKSMPDHHMIMQVHDELVFDFPKETNETVINTIKDIMEDKGRDIGIPLTVGIDRHPNNWSESL